MPTAGLKQAPNLFVAEMTARRVTTTHIAAPIPLRSPAVCSPFTIKITLMKMKVQMISFVSTWISIEKPSSVFELSGAPVYGLVGARRAIIGSPLPKLPR